MNPLGSMPGSSNNIAPLVQQSKRMTQMVNGVRNPEQVLARLAQNNPQVKSVMDLCQGKNPEQVFRNMCTQRGINPDEIIQALKQ